MKELSCYQQGKRGAPCNYFAVPDEDFQTGAVTGTKLFMEIVEHMRNHGDRSAVYLPFLLEDMGKAHNEKGVKNRNGAAATVEWLIADTLLHFAQNANFKPWLESKLAEAEKQKVWWDEREAKRKAEFVTRMKAAKLAKSRAASQDAMCAI